MFNLMHLLPLHSLLSLIFILPTPSLSAPHIPFPENTSPPDTPTWCGKAYRAEDPPFTSLVKAGWQYAPPYSSHPLLELRCWPRYKPVISGGIDRSISTPDGDDKTALMIDARVSHHIGSPIPEHHLLSLKIPGEEGSWNSNPTSVYITVKTRDGDILAERVSVPLGSDENPAQTEIEINISALVPRREEHELRCYGHFSPDPDSVITIASSDFYYLPRNHYPNATTVVLDHKTGDLEVWDLPTGSKLPKRFFPVGWYTSWSDYLVGNWDLILHEMVAEGYNIIHPVPSGAGRNAWLPLQLEDFVTFLDSAERAGIYVQYDLRHSLTSPNNFNPQITLIRAHPALLLYYTADEPDGAPTPTNSTWISYQALSRLDPYHPISLALNCRNYFLPQYSSGADILLPDPYPIGVNATWSRIYHTPCTREYGCCGCDLCESGDWTGELERRVEEGRGMLRWVGMRKVWWGVVQGFGGEGGEFWGRDPEGEEVIELGVRGVRGGARGLVTWIAPAGEGVREGMRGLVRVVKGLVRTEDGGNKGEVGGIRDEL